MSLEAVQELNNKIIEVENQKIEKREIIQNELNKTFDLLINHDYCYNMLVNEKEIFFTEIGRNYDDTLTSIKEMNKIIEKLNNKEIPDNYDILVKSNHLNYCSLVRYILTFMSSYCIISNDWIVPLAEKIKKNNFKCLEIMAGSGLLSYALQKQGVDIIATDSMKYDWKENNAMYGNVEELSAKEAIKKYGKNVDIIIMSWAPYDSFDAYKALKVKKKYSPKSLLIGIDEGYGGCVANYDFFDRVTDLCEEENYNKYPSMKRFEEIIHSIATDEIIVPQWSYIHDRLNCYK